MKRKKRSKSGVSMKKKPTVRRSVKKKTIKSVPRGKPRSGKGKLRVRKSRVKDKKPPIRRKVRVRRRRVVDGGGAAYNAGFNQSYNEGYNAGFTKGFEDGHQIAYEQQV